MQSAIKLPSFPEFAGNLCAQKFNKAQEKQDNITCIQTFEGFWIMRISTGVVYTSSFYTLSYLHFTSLHFAPTYIFLLSLPEYSKPLIRSVMQKHMTTLRPNTNNGYPTMTPLLFMSLSDDHLASRDYSVVKPIVFNKDPPLPNFRNSLPANTDDGTI